MQIEIIALGNLSCIETNSFNMKEIYDNLTTNNHINISWKAINSGFEIYDSVTLE